MPYKSAKQRGYLHAKEPALAAKWDKKYGGKVKKNRGEGWLKPVIAGTVAGGLANQFPRVQDVERAHRRKKKGAVKKMLLPISDDPDFNQAAAQRAFDLVMKMDDDTAEMFTQIVVSDYFEETVEKNLGTLQRHLDYVIRKQLENVKQAHLRLVAKGMDTEEAVAYAQAISLFSKAVEFEEKLHPRGEGGRFRTAITHNQTKEIHHKTAQALLGIETPDQHTDGRKLDSKQRTQFQDEYRQLADFMSSVNQSTGGSGNHEVLLHFQDGLGRQFTDKVSGTVPPKDMLTNPDLTLIGAEARPTTLTAGGAAFGLSGALGHQMSPSQVAGVNAVTEGGGAGRFADQWTNAGDGTASNARLYGRTAAAGQFMGAVGPPGSKTQLAGKFAEIVGNAGPQAEAVIGPTARKTAYRYRGTERTPDPDLARSYKQGIEQSKQAGEDEIPIARMGARRIAAAARPPTWDERDGGRAAVVQHLKDTLPSPQLYALQLASGNTPPSEGVIINANGQLATQAVGYADDHYLPFNLKHLKELKGGEYIRNRSVGGLTAEDVYAGLISGARQVTVTSRSGTFTMTFQDDFRGGRRHNDKARRMTRRYEQLLDAVQSGQVERAQIPPEIKATIGRQVREEYAGQGNVTIRNITKEREKEYRSDPELSDIDEQAARHLALARFNDDNSPDAKAFIRQRLNDLQRKKQVNWQLNGDGYAAALQGLQEQFPYYIKTDSHVEDDEDKTSLERDKGYVEPGRNRPTEARGAGLFGTNINPGLKRDGLTASTASHVDYQRGRFETRSAAAPKTTVEGGKEGEKKPDAKANPKQYAAQVAQDIKHRTAADELYEGMQSPLIDPSVKTAFPWLSDRDEYERMMKGPEGPAAVEGLVEALTKSPEPGKPAAIGSFPQAVKDAVQKWKLSGTAIGSGEFVAGAYPSTPPPFPGDAYKKGGDRQLKWNEYQRVNSRYGRSLKFGGSIGMLSDSQLKQEHDALVGVLSAIKNNPEVVQATNEAGADTRTAIAAAFFESAAPDTVAVLMKGPDQIEQKMKLIQQLRSLKASGLDPAAQMGVREGGGGIEALGGNVDRSLNVAKPPAQIFADKSDDIVDAEVVEEPPDPAERAKMMRQQTGHLVTAAKKKLAQKPEDGWTANEYDLQNAINDYENDPPTTPAEQDAVHQNLYSLHRQIF